MSLRIGKLPDQTPVKLTISIDPELHDCLSDYAAIYEREYGKHERIEVLAPVMLEAFLQGDSAFKRARKTLHQPPKQEI